MEAHLAKIRGRHMARSLKVKASYFQTREQSSEPHLRILGLLFLKKSDMHLKLMKYLTKTIFKRGT